jgi:hypothetical protein
VRPAVPPGEWEFYGITYPDTSAGLKACNAAGLALVVQNPRSYANWKCILNDPNAGYNLWLYVDGA